MMYFCIVLTFARRLALQTAINPTKKATRGFFTSFTVRGMSNSTFSFKSFLNFLRVYNLQHTVTLIVLLIGYGLKVFSTTFSIDTEAIMEVPDSLYNSWFGLERFGLVIFKYLTGTYWYNNALASFFMVFSLFIATLLWAHLLNEVIDKNDLKFHPSFFSCIFIASPVLAEMLGFLLLGPEVAIAIGLVALSLMASINGFSTRRIHYFIFAIIFASIAFSMYLAVVTLFITGTAILAILKNDISEKTRKHSFVFLLFFGILFVVSYCVYLVANKIAQIVTGIPTNPYISEQSRWGKEPGRVIIQNILNHAISMYHGYGIYYSAFFSIFIVVFVIIQIVRIVRHKTSILSLVISLLICASPLMMSVILGSDPSVRTELSYALSFAFVTSFIASFISSWKIGKIAAWICVLALTFNQASITNRIFYSEKIRFDATTQLSYEIKSRIDDLGLGTKPKEPVVFIGQPEDACNSSCYSEDQLQGLTGRSIFRLTVSAAQGTFVKNHFMKGIGIDFAGSNDKQLDQAVEIAKKMPQWPAEGSVKVADGIIVIRLS
jgi:hypothetical protein